MIVSDYDLTVFCWILNTDDPFPIDIGKSKTVGHLKKMIKKENEHDFAAIDAKALVIWKVGESSLYGSMISDFREAIYTHSS
jgi:hypothetical protein